VQIARTRLSDKTTPSSAARRAEPARAYELEVPADYAHELEVNLDAHADHIEPRRHPKKSSVFVFLDKRAIPAKGSEQATAGAPVSLSFAGNIDHIGASPKRRHIH
jgi:hypothetical protein